MSAESINGKPPPLPSIIIEIESATSSEAGVAGTPTAAAGGADEPSTAAAAMGWKRNVYAIEKKSPRTSSSPRGSEGRLKDGADHAPVKSSTTVSEPIMANHKEKFGKPLFVKPLSSPPDDTSSKGAHLDNDMNRNEHVSRKDSTESNIIELSALPAMTKPKIRIEEKRVKDEKKPETNGAVVHVKRQPPKKLHLLMPSVTISDDTQEAFSGSVKGAGLMPSPMPLGSSTSSGATHSLSLLAPSPHPSSATPDTHRTDSRLSFMVRERLHSIVSDINRRTIKLKAQIQQPPTPDTMSMTSATADENEKEPETRSLGSFVGEMAATTAAPAGPKVPETVADGSRFATVKKLYNRLPTIMPEWLDQQSKLYLTWLAIVSACVVYNAYAIPLRAAYPYQTRANLCYWLTLDYLCDFIYLLDLLLFKPRLPFVRDGIAIKDPAEMRKNYVKSWTFRLDFASLFPLDLLFFLPQVKFSPLLRIHRILKIKSYWDFFYAVDTIVDNPYILRIGKTLSYMIYLVHCNSCIYYAFSVYEGVGANTWVYSGKGIAYIRCFYFAFKTGVGIGNNESPRNAFEHIYMTLSWLMGVFVFALLLGQIRDIVATANKNKEVFRKCMDATLEHCKQLKLSKPLQDKVRMWFIYTWEDAQTLDENRLIEKLPRKMQTDLAISCHYQTLSKVKLFQDCDKALLRDLVLKLKSVLFLPGDYVCRKGEVGKEMYIVNKGMVQVLGAKDQVLVVLKEGSVFGEISLLALSGGNRRTADVRSKGFSNLFVLSKDDLQETIKDYPEAQKILKRKAKKLLAQSKARQQAEEQVLAETKLEDECQILKDAPRTPKMLQAVVQVMKPGSETALALQKAMAKAQRHNSDGLEDSDVSEISSIAGEDMNTLMKYYDDANRLRATATMADGSGPSWQRQLSGQPLAPLQSGTEDEEDEELIVVKTEVTNFGSDEAHDSPPTADC